MKVNDIVTANINGEVVKVKIIDVKTAKGILFYTIFNSKTGRTITNIPEEALTELKNDTISVSEILQAKDGSAVLSISIKALQRVLKQFKQTTNENNSMLKTLQEQQDRIESLYNTKSKVEKLLLEKNEELKHCIAEKEELLKLRLNLAGSRIIDKIVIDE